MNIPDFSSVNLISLNWQFLNKYDNLSGKDQMHEDRKEISESYENFEGEQGEIRKGE